MYSLRFDCFSDKFDFYTMEDADKFWGPVFLFMFTLLVTFVLVNFFITIIIEAFVIVKYDISKQSNDHEVVDYMINKFKAVTGIGSTGTMKRQHVSNIMAYDPTEYCQGRVTYVD